MLSPFLCLLQGCGGFAKWKLRWWAGRVGHQSLDLERSRTPFAVRHMAAATISLQAFHVSRSLVEIACRCIFRDGRSRRDALRGGHAQCVSGTRIVQLNRRTRVTMDEVGVIQKFGVPPVSIPDYLALVGDAADGYPDLSGWGPKFTAAVLGKFGHLESIPADWRDWHVNAANASALATRFPRSVTRQCCSECSQRCGLTSSCSTT